MKSIQFRRHRYSTCRRSDYEGRSTVREDNTHGVISSLQNTRYFHVEVIQLYDTLPTCKGKLQNYAYTYLSLFVALNNHYALLILFLNSLRFVSLCETVSLSITKRRNNWSRIYIYSVLLWTLCVKTT
jgi:hypothetical protein